MSSHVIVILLLVKLTSADDYEPCRPGAELSKYGDACFAPLSVDTFYAAELTCLQMGGHLPTVTDPSVNDQLISLAGIYFSCQSIWIGLDAREKWLDGSLSIYRNWESGYEGQPTTCVSLVMNSQKWKKEDCTLTKGFFCSFPTLYDMGSTEKPMKACPLTDNDGDSDTGLTTGFPCTIGSNNCPNWNTIVMIGLSAEQSRTQIKTKLQDIADYLKSMTSDCSSESLLTLVTPADAHYNLNCSTVKTNQGTVAELVDNLDSTRAKFITNDSATEIYDMFQAMQQCSSFNLAPNFGGAVLFFTDLGCSEVCRQVLVNSQKEIVNNMTANHYSIRFAHIGLDASEEGCFTEVFGQCGVYSKAICDFRSFDNLQEAKDDPSMQVCEVRTNDSNEMPTVWIIILSVIGLLIIIGCVGVRCFFRYKSLKKGNKWSWFVWRSPEENGASLGDTKQRAQDNDYDEVPREDDVWEIKPENLTFTEQDVLGSGAFATVYLGYLRGEIPLTKVHRGTLKLGLRKEQDDSYKVAVKRLPPHATAEGRMDFNHEIQFMKELGYHSHVLSLLGVVTSTHDSLIVVENCDFGDLLSFVRTRKETFLMCEPENFDITTSLRTKDLMSIAWQISDGMSYLGSKNFIHRDIAARNILLTKSMVAKIGDFGLCRLVDSSLYTAKGGRLPIKWMAPESLKYYEYSLKSDIWSFGILLFELFSLGEAPYGTIQPQDMPKYLDEGNRLPQPATCPNEIFEIMAKCWERTVELRPDIDQIRDNLTNLLNSDSTSYGYLAVSEVQEDNDVCEI